MKYKSLLPRAILLGIALTLILPACTPPLQTIDPSILTPKAKPNAEVKNKATSCSEFELIHAARGKPNVTVSDIQAALLQPDPIAHVRNYVGDTIQTLAQVDEHNAAWHAVCDQ